jgi:hypothetical protein
MTATQLSPGSVRKTAAGATAPGRRRAFDRYLNPVLGVLGVAVVLAAWQI